jgi:preprotein translocase subunit SecA
MNQQREIVYEYRDRILEGQDMSEIARTQIAEAIERLCGLYLEGEYQEEWDLDAMLEQLEQVYPVSYTAEDVGERDTRATLIEKLRADVVEAYDDREEELGEELMRSLERFMLLQIIDERWREHLHDMDYLREGIHLRGFAQIDPLVAYKNEGFEMFTELMNNIWDEFARYVFNVEVEVAPEQQDGGNGSRWGASSNQSSTGRRLNYAGGTAADQPSALAAAAQTAGGVVPAGVAEAAEYAVDASAEPPPVVETRRLDEHERIGRNDPCWCGSGKKFKKCHGAAQ